MTEVRTSGQAPACTPETGCMLCGDVAVRARVVAVDPAADMARVDVLDPGHGTSLEVALDLVTGVAVGDVILVHQGFAIERVDP